MSVCVCTVIGVKSFSGYYPSCSKCLRKLRELKFGVKIKSGGLVSHVGEELGSANVMNIIYRVRNIIKLTVTRI